MRSSSSRNLASSPNSGRALRNQLQTQISTDSVESQREQFIAMQVMQAVLFTARIFFLSYEIVYTAVHKNVIYRRVGYILGSEDEPTKSESLYTACLFLITLFLISLIIITFVYNYIIVHENLNGIVAMCVFLLMMLLYYVFTFGRFPMSKLESSCVCIASGFEILGLFYLYVLVKHKKAYKYVQQFEKRFSVLGPANLGGIALGGSNGNGATNRQLPHQRRLDAKGLGSPTPPAITISYTGNEEHKQHDEEDVPESELTTSQPEEELDRSSEPDGDHDNSQAENESQSSGQHQRQRRNKQSTRSRQSRKHISDNESESSMSIAELQHPPLHHHRPRARKHRSKDLLTVPGQYSDLEEQEEEQEEQEQEGTLRSAVNSRAPSASPAPGDEYRHESGLRTKPVSVVPHHDSAYQAAGQHTHRSAESFVRSSMDPESSYHEPHHHSKQHHYVVPQRDYGQQQAAYTDEYAASRSPTNYRR